MRLLRTGCGSNEQLKSSGQQNTNVDFRALTQNTRANGLFYSCFNFQASQINKFLFLFLPDLGHVLDFGPPPRLSGLSPTSNTDTSNDHQPPEPRAHFLPRARCPRKPRTITLKNTNKLTLFLSRKLIYANTPHHFGFDSSLREPFRHLKSFFCTNTWICTTNNLNVSPYLFAIFFSISPISKSWWRTKTWILILCLVLNNLFQTFRQNL